MPRGRPPAIAPLDPEHPGPVSQQVGEIGDRNRITIPISLTEDAAWFPDQKKLWEALVVLHPPGRIVLLPWEPAGQAVLRRRAELIDQAGTDEDILESIRLLEDRYKRLEMPRKEGTRPTLTADILTHLGITSDERPVKVYVLRIRDRIEIWSMNFRNVRLTAIDDVLRDLP